MTIAELFVNLGVKGNSETAKKMKDVDTGLANIRSTGLAAKAAIVAVFYSLQQLMSKSAETGSQLNSFANSTGLSAEMLQRWQYAGRQFNVSADEVQSSITSVQDAMTKLILGKGAPEGLGFLSTVVDFDMEKVRDTFYVMQKLQEFSQKVPADVAKNVIKSFGLNDNMISAMRQNAFNAESLAKAPIFSDRQIEALRKIDAAWANIGDKIMRIVANLSMANGGKLLADISKIIDALGKLSQEALKLANALKVFELISLAFEGWVKILKIASDLIKQIITMLPQFSGYKSATDFMKNAFGDAGAWVLENWGKDFSKQENILPPTKQGGKTSMNNTEINQNFNFQHPGENARDVGMASKSGVEVALRQMSAQAQGA